MALFFNFLDFCFYFCFLSFKTQEKSDKWPPTGQTPSLP